jgi:hypothetical protein
MKNILCCAALLCAIFSCETFAQKPTSVNLLQGPQVDDSNMPNFFGGPQQVAQQRAQRMADYRVLQHWQGSIAGCTYEGIGYGLTPQEALDRCCLTGLRPVVAQAVVKGSPVRGSPYDGIRYYAVKLYR